MTRDSKISDIKVVFGVDLTRHINVKLDDFKKTPFQLISINKLEGNS